MKWCLPIVAVIGAALGIADSALSVQSSTASIVERASAATVALKCIKDGQLAASGSGFFVDNSGVLVTSYHVVQDCSEVKVLLENEDQYAVTSVFAVDPDKDIAILRVSGYRLPVIALGDSSIAQRGDRVLVLGNPLGLRGSVTEGIISAVRSAQGMHVFQLDAAISPGSSGGPVLNDSGEVIAIAAFRLTEGEALNFAVPSNYVHGLLEIDKKLTLGALKNLRTSPFRNDFDPQAMPRDWIQLGHDGTTAACRLDASPNLIVIEKFWPSEESKEIRFTEFFEFHKSGDSWTPTWKMSLDCYYRDVSRRSRKKRCTLTRQGRVIELDRDRIYVEFETPVNPSGGFDCETCSSGTGGFKWITFTLYPSE